MIRYLGSIRISIIQRSTEKNFIHCVFCLRPCFFVADAWSVEDHETGYGVSTMVGLPLAHTIIV